MQTAHISTAPEDYLTTAELAEARTMYERLCARIRRIISGRIARHGTADASSHWQAIRDRVTASRRSATADDAQVFELVREWRNIAALADRETSGPPRATARLLELADKMTASYETARVAARSTAARDELLHTDPSGDRLYAAPPRGKHGTLLFIRPGEGEVYVPTAAVDALRAALTGGVAPAEAEHLRQQATAMDTFRAVLDGAEHTPTDRAAVLNAAANVARSKLHPDHDPDSCAPCSMASVIEYELRRMADAALTAEPTPELPRTTAAGRAYLRQFAAATLHVYRDPAKPGSGVSRPALDRLLRDGLVVLGEYVPLMGKPIALTDLGRAVLAAHPVVTGD